MNLGKAIRLIRTQKNLKQSDLAQKAGVSVSFLSLLERDKRDVNFSTIERIAQGLELPISILLFIASDKDDMNEMSPELSQRLSQIVLELIRQELNEKASL